MRRTLVAILLCLGLVACAGTGDRRPDFSTTTEIQVSAVVAVGGHSAFAGWTGTGWYIAEDGDNSVVATAGHVCMYRGDTIGPVEVLMTFSTVSSPEPVDAYPIYDHDGSPDDTCLLYVPHSAPGVIKIGPDPKQGDPVSYVGFPHGNLGTHTGTVIGLEPDNGYLIASIPVYFGASGSAVVDSRGRAVGIISVGDMTTQQRAGLVPTSYLRQAKAYADAFLRRLRTKPFETSRGVILGEIDRGPN